MRFDTTELAALVDTLNAGQGKALTMADMAVRKAGMDAAATAQANAPVDTGYHRGTITSDHVGPATVEMGASSEYAPYLENGTYKMRPRPHIIPAAESVLPALTQALNQIPEGLL